MGPRWAGAQRLRVRGSSPCALNALWPQAYCMMVESTPEFSHPLSAMYQLWTEGSWMRGWLFSTFIHLSSGDALYRLPWNAVRLRLMTDPNRYVPSPGRSLLFALSDTQSVREQSSVGSVECLRTAHTVVRLASIPLVCRTDVRAAASR